MIVCDSSQKGLRQPMSSGIPLQIYTHQFSQCFQSQGFAPVSLSYILSQGCPHAAFLHSLIEVSGYLCSPKGSVWPMKNECGDINNPAPLPLTGRTPGYDLSSLWSSSCGIEPKAPSLGRWYFQRWPQKYIPSYMLSCNKIWSLILLFLHLGLSEWLLARSQIQLNQ